ncbi:MAG: hypothetical protein AABY22_01470 [Nanoarchaeota archaeon]
MSKIEKQLTSVKVDPQAFEDFKINAIRHKFSLQKLADRAIYLYNSDPEFRKMLHNTVLPVVTESKG